MGSISVTARKRLLWLLIIIFMLFIALIIRLGWLQIKQGPILQQKAYNQWAREISVSPKRGIIYDRNGRILAQSASSETIIVRPLDIVDPEGTADKLAPIIDMDRDEILKIITDKTKSEKWLKRQVSKEEANAVRQLGLKGIKFTEEAKRYYPNENLASHILGFVGRDGQGLDGVELQYDKYLKGKEGKIVTQTDGKARELPMSPEQYIKPQDGDNVYLTIDAVIQHFAEKAVEQALSDNKAKKAIGVVMDPKTGEILALTNKPDFNPNGFPAPELKTAKDIEEATRNAAVKDTYEPGSTFKIITSAAGLDSGAVKPDDTFYDPGYKIVAGQRIKCWRSYNPHGHETFVEGVQNSCNPVFMEVGERMGVNTFYNYINQFGFGQKTGLDLPGEGRGLLQKQDNVGPVELATISFGQGISVTPVQLVTAISAAVNGGQLITPHVMKQVKDNDGNIVVDNKPQIVRRVISEQTSETLRPILESVVSEGTGKAAYIEGYRIGGKTGTAETYQAGKYISSFVAFAPADDPKIVVLVVVQEPNAGTYFGSTVAAPAVKSIISDTFDYWGIKPNIEGQQPIETITVPDVRNMTLEEASKKLDEAGLTHEIAEEGSIVVDMMPKPGAKVPSNTVIILYAESQQALSETRGNIEVPDLFGLSIREAEEELEKIGLKLKQGKGNGLIIDQRPRAGTKVKEGAEVIVNMTEGN